MTASSKDIFGDDQDKLNPNEGLSVLNSKGKRENTINSLNQIKSRINEDSYPGFFYDFELDTNEVEQLLLPLDKLLYLKEPRVPSYLK